MSQSDYNEALKSSWLSWVWLEVPGFYQCKEDPGMKTALSTACHQSFTDNGGYVPCFVSRPFVSFVEC